MTVPMPVFLPPPDFATPAPVKACCTEDHPDGEPCRWFCSTCTGTAECPDCDGNGYFAGGAICDTCEATGICPEGCTNGVFFDQHGGQPVITIRPTGGVL